ncbi:MAG: DUF480 domain-containing protein [Austwickia sp.]|nr:DUF480 domain-containing protein [Austwickia sp.]MBK8436607.1 DUF480 domain-containing protein [Austwickia sp.]MBK9102272.1 DUF480 domain-containing protein [Austwickia sp.]
MTDSTPATTAPLPELDAMDQRVLGSLMEKQRTVPAAYPLTVTALRSACNQTSSRDPVVEYAAQDLENCLRELRHRGLVRVVHTPGQRALKYHQLLTDVLELADDERALITVLLLRGPQTPGELRTRTERLHPYADRVAVEQVLQRLAHRDPALVRELPRLPGQHERRWVQLLGPLKESVPDDVVRAARHAAQEAVDREAVLADGAPARDDRVRAAYQVAAAAYADGAPIPALTPFEGWLAERVADWAQGRPMADVGCGTGRFTAALAAAGAHVTGVDVVAEMVAAARSVHPGVPFQRADLRALMRPVAAAAWAAVTAWDALGHLAPSELPGAIAALVRVLEPGGLLAIDLAAGDQIRLLEELAGVRLVEPVTEVLHDPEQVLHAVRHAGAQVLEWYLRGDADAGPDTASRGDRLTVLARRPA